ncbi:MAG: phage protein Gp27 family protein [Collimonas sp.]|uniref:phage protein Gp27 family protein n=1 Tax=Collimonas sp. TaxID=1963772 RepID=UPI003263169F
MGGKSNITRLEPEVRKYLEKLLRENRLTLDEMVSDVRAKFPDQDAPSRSSLHRYRSGFDEMVCRMREIETAAGALVDELGDGVGDKAGALLAQAVTTLATNAALNAHDDDKITIKEVGELARAARAAMQARTMSIKERETIEGAARAKLLREQEAKLDTMGKTGALAPDTLKRIRAEIYGIV